MKEFLNAFKILSDSEVDDLIKVTTPKTLNKNEYFIKDGQICDQVAFIKSGILRSFYISDSGEEITYCMAFSPNFMTSYTSFITGERTSENIQAIMPTELWVIPKQEIERLSETSINWIKFLKMVAEQQYILLEKRIFQFQKEKAKQRYIDLFKEYPKYIQMVPLHYIASYLGITVRHLSRLRKEILSGHLSSFK